MFQLQILCQTVIYLCVCFNWDIYVLSSEIPIIILILIKANVMLVSGSFTSLLLWQTLCSSAPSTVHYIGFIGRLNRTTYQHARRAHSAGAEASLYLGIVDTMSVTCIWQGYHLPYLKKFSTNSRLNFFVLFFI